MAETAGLAGEAYVIVRDRILRGELAIGQVVSRRRLAAELGMTLLPVSEALQRLEDEGLLESRPRAGTRVRLPTPDDVRGHYTVREALEVQAAMLFAEVATAEERAELQKLAVRVDTLSTQADGNRFVYLSVHEKFHRRIAECARCNALSIAIDRTSALASTWLCASRAGMVDSPPRRTHQDLVQELVKSDPHVAGEAMRNHIRSSMQNTLARLEPYFNLPEKYTARYSRVNGNLPVFTPVDDTVSSSDAVTV
jgi:GntR family transcriptional regulator, rspAB operon transcriptional repressor